MSVKIFINGCCGRMGLEVVRVAIEDPNVVLAGGLEREGHPFEGRDLGELCGMGKTGANVFCDISSFDMENAVLIDFSAPGSTESLLKTITGKKCSLVIGTTGIGDLVSGHITEISKQTPVVFSPNMGLGINILFYLTEFVTKRLGLEFDVEIVEAHHRFKKDSPSGTARRLAEIASESMGRTYNDTVVDGRCGLVGERPSGQIGMHAVRGGDIVGDHTVLFAGMGERIELKHVAHSRSTFARGAVLAAKWLASRKPGLYSMRDVLGL